MTKEAIKERVEAPEFRPFKIRLADGRAYEIPARDFASLSPAGRTLTVWSGEETLHILDVALIAEIEVNKP